MTLHLHMDASLTGDSIAIPEWTGDFMTIPGCSSLVATRRCRDRMRSVNQRLVHERGEFRADVGGIRQVLDHDDEYEVRLRIQTVRGAIPTRPPKRTPGL